MSQYCQLCERGFPLKGAFHIPTQALGMIPVTRCKAIASTRTNTRNKHGVKASCDCYRTIDGHEYQAWTSCPSADRIAAYRAAGVRCRRFKDELFVHVFDTEEAAKVDSKLGH